MLDDPGGCQREVAADQLSDRTVGDSARPLRIDVDAHRLGDADGVGKLDLAAIRQLRRDIAALSAS